MSFSRLVAHNFKQLTTPVIGATLMLCMGAAQADDSSLVIRGKDGWLFPGWGSLTTVDTKSIDSNTALIKDTRDALQARGVKLIVLMLPDKTLFYQDKLPADKTLSPQVKERYQTILGKLKQAGIRTVHYVSPSVWAWREGRAAKIGRSADRVLCLFPMEPPIYQRHGIDARFVGHPLAEAFDAVPDRRAARERLGLDQDIPVLAVLPGSRQGEIQRLWPTFIDAARLVTVQLPGLAVAVPAADPACRDAIEAGLAKSQRANVALYDGQAHDVMVAADVVLLASGTAALEAMLAKRPMVVGYRISALTYRLVMGLGLMRVNRYSLPNVLANEPIVPELMQHDCTPENLADALMAWFRDTGARAALLPRLHAPAGLFLGGEGPEAIALAIAADLQRSFHAPR